MDFHATEVDQGGRFEFGVNWQHFLAVVNDERVREAKRSLQQMLEVERLDGSTFIDIGSGSGIFSLAARSIGAKVYSFNYDPQSVACTAELKHRYFPDDPDWIVDRGSVLDKDYLKSIGQFDIVYSWGVLHHTGAMWQALENVISLVADGGKLFIAIYNDQGRASRWWRKVKWVYNMTPRPLRFIILWPAFLRLWGPTIMRDLASNRCLTTWKEYIKSRGMTPWRDVVDWVGGFPFEVAKPEDIFYFCKRRCFTLVKLKTSAGGLGCNEFVFEKAIG